MFDNQEICFPSFGPSEMQGTTVRTIVRRITKQREAHEADIADYGICKGSAIAVGNQGSMPTDAGSLFLVGERARKEWGGEL